MKKLDKQIVSALAIGIGAGLMMCPVTAYADEGEPDENKNDDPVTTDAGDEQKSDENTGTQETAEAAQAMSEAAAAVDSAQAAVPTAPEGETNGYEDANAALNSAENQIKDATTEVGNAQDALDTAKSDIDTASAQDKIVDDKASEIDRDYGKTTSDAQAAIDIVDGIDTDNDSMDSAKKAASNAQKKVTDAENAFSDAETAQTEATSASEAAKSALDDIVAQKEAYDDQIEAAEHDLALAETALITAASDFTDKKSAAVIALSNLDGDLGKKIDDLRKAISDASGEELQAKVAELGKLLGENFALSADEKEAYEKGDISFEYKLDDSGRIVVTKVVKTMDPAFEVIEGTPEGFYSEDGSMYAGGYEHEVRQDNTIYAYNDSDFITESGSVPKDEPDTNTTSEDWHTYELIEGSEANSIKVENNIVKDITTNDYNVTTYSRWSVQTEVNETPLKAHQLLEDQFENDEFVRQFLEEKGSSDYEFVRFEYIEFDPREGLEFETDEFQTLYGCHLNVILKTKNPYRITRTTNEKQYNCTRYDYRAKVEDEYKPIEIAVFTRTEAVYSNSYAVNKAVSDYEGKLADAEAALQDVKDAEAVYNGALSKVTAAREKVNALTDSFVSEVDVKNAKDAHTAALAHLESAQDKKTAAEKKLKEAKEALKTAADKIKAIDERIKAEQQAAQNNEGDGQGGDDPTGDGGNPTGNGDDPTGNGDDPTGNGDDPTGDGEGSGVTPGGTNIEPGSEPAGNGGTSENGGTSGSSGSSDNGSSSDDGNSGNDTVTNDQPQIVPTVAGATKADNSTETTVTPLVAGVKTTVIRTAPTTRRAQMSQLAQSLSDEVARLNDAETVEEKSEEPSKVLASTDAGSKAGKNVSKAFTSSVDGAVANIEDEETALSATATNNSVKFPIIFALLGAIVAGVSVSEFIRMKKEDNEMF